MSYVDVFIAEVRSWIGTPYKMRMSRKSKQGGSNCAQFVQFSLEASLPTGEVPVREFDHVKLIRTRENVGVPFLLQFCHEITLEELEPGDIVVIEYAEIPVQPIVYTGNDQFIFCFKHSGVIEGPLPVGILEKAAYILRPNIFQKEKENDSSSNFMAR